MTEETAQDTRRMASDIVAAYVANNQMRPDEVPGFLSQIIATLRDGNTEAAPAAVEHTAAPAVPVRRSVRDDAVVCLECGVAMKTLKRHIGNAHGLSERAYREKWGLQKDHPLVAPSYSQQRSAMAKKIGLGKGSRGRRGRKSS